MKDSLLVLLIVSQAFGAMPAAAASLELDARLSAQQRAAFAGARLRVPFGGAEAGKARATLAVAPTLHGQRSDGSVRVRFGEGFELGARRGEEPRLSFGGRQLSHFGQGKQTPEGPKAGISTIGWVAIGVGTAALLYLTVFGLCAEEVICNFDDE
jgi:hypothetical protein